MPPSKTFRATIYRDGAMCFIPVTFDPKEVFGKLRAPVKVTLNGTTYRSTIASMGNGPCLPLRRSNREAAGLEGGETLDVTLTLDTEARVVEVPADLAKSLSAAPAAKERWAQLSYSHQKEHVDAIEEAKKPETRARRIEAAIAMLVEQAATKAKPAATKAKPAAKTKQAATRSAATKSGAKTKRTTTKAKPATKAKQSEPPTSASKAKRPAGASRAARR